MAEFEEIADDDEKMTLPPFVVSNSCLGKPDLLICFPFWYRLSTICKNLHKTLKIMKNYSEINEMQCN